ncbi:MAG: precorrin-2 C(20)-methyltransferase [Deltaproteobacteria bacterium]|nr:precorrin-2 C(20)-methyltransferase [Deltaproteobacteria bacterium]
MKNNRKLYFIGIGPGDPELLTLKAVRLIKGCDVLFFPAGKKSSEDSIAMKVIEGIVDLENKRVCFLHFPMVKGADKIIEAAEPSAQIIDNELAEGETGVFITIGCSTIYSTAGNMFASMKNRDIDIFFVPGVSSINATASSAGIPLVFSEEKLAVIPVAYSMDVIESAIEMFDTIVLMKVHTNMGKIREIIINKGLAESSYMVERATTSEEKVSCISGIPNDYKPHYMSSILIKKNFGD